MPVRSRGVLEYHYFVRLGYVALLVLIIAPSYPAGDWQRFRGPNGSGVAEGGSLPREIAADKNVVWKVAIPGRGPNAKVDYFCAGK